MRLQLVFGSIALGVTAAAFFAACSDSTFEGTSNDASTDGEITGDSALDAGSDGAGSLDASGDAGPCPSKGGPAMVQVPSNGLPYCIDSTEVTRGQYAVFVSDVAHHTYNPAPDPRCAWNTDVEVNAVCAPTEVGDAGAAGADELPVTCINWCDAFSFCDWAGKRLCGTIGSTATLSPNYEAADKNVSQWENACSANGTQTFPYKGPFADGGCNVEGPYANPELAAVGAYAQCNGGYDGIYDMAGNASEWVNACNSADGGDESQVTCVRIGGSYMRATQFPTGACADYGSNARLNTSQDVGFRCCSK